MVNPRMNERINETFSPKKVLDLLFYCFIVVVSYDKRERTSHLPHLMLVQNDCELGESENWQVTCATSVIIEENLRYVHCLNSLSKLRATDNPSLTQVFCG